MSQLTTYGSESLGRPKSAMLWQVSAANHLIKRKYWISWPSSDSWNKPHMHRSWAHTDFHHPNIWWGDNTAGHKQLKMFQVCTEDDFLTPLIKQPTRGDALLDFILTNKEELIRGVTAGASLGCSDHEMWSSGSMEKGTRKMAGSQPWNLGEQTMAYSETCLEQSHRL